MIKKENSYILSIDIGIASLGYLIREDKPARESKIIEHGVLICPQEKDNSSKTPNQKRQEYRSSRKGLRRKNHRRYAIGKILQEKSMIPLKRGSVKKKMTSPLNKKEDVFLKKWIDQDVYALRKRNIDGEKLSLEEIGRILYHFTHRRGVTYVEEENIEHEKNENSSDQKKIKTTEDAMKKGGHRYLGEYFYQLIEENKGKKIEGKEKRQRLLLDDINNNNIPETIKNRVIPRNFYKKEFDLLWSNQSAFHGNVLSDELRRKIKFYLFWQHPVVYPKRSQCVFHPLYKRARKRCLFTENYNTYKLLNTILVDGKKLTEEQRERAVLYIMYQGKECKISDLLKFLYQTENLEDFSINYEKILDDKLPGMIAHHYLLNLFVIQQNRDLFFKEKDGKNSLKKIEEVESELKRLWEEIPMQEKYKLWQKIFNSGKIKELLIKKLPEDWRENSFILEFIEKHPLFVTQTVNISTHVIKKSLPYLMEGYTEDKALLLASIPEVIGEKWKVPIGRNGDFIPKKENLSTKSKEAIEKIKEIISNKNSNLLDDTITFLEEKFKIDKKDIKKLYIPDTLKIQSKRDLPMKIDYRTGNPALDKMLMLVLRFLKEVYKKYGTQITIIREELARDTSKTEDQKKKIYKAQKENYKKNSIARGYLTELNQFNGDIAKKTKKVRLWMEALTKKTKNINQINEHALCVYTGKKVTLKEALKSMEIEHINPRCVLYDNSFSNTTLCPSFLNDHKDGRTPYEAFGKNKHLHLFSDPKELKNATWENMKKRAKGVFGAKSSKYKKFISEKGKDEDFLQKDLANTGWIGKKILLMVRNIFRDAKIETTKGAVTSFITKKSGLHRILNGHIYPYKVPENISYQLKNSCTFAYIVHDQHGELYDFEPISLTEEEKKIYDQLEKDVPLIRIKIEEKGKKKKIFYHYDQGIEGLPFIVEEKKVKDYLKEEDHEIKLTTQGIANRCKNFYETIENNLQAARKKLEKRQDDYEEDEIKWGFLEIKDDESFFVPHTLRNFERKHQLIKEWLASIDAYNKQQKKIKEFKEKPLSPGVEKRYREHKPYAWVAIDQNEHIINYNIIDREKKYDFIGLDKPLELIEKNKKKASINFKVKVKEVGRFELNEKEVDLERTNDKQVYINHDGYGILLSKMDVFFEEVSKVQLESELKYHDVQQNEYKIKKTILSPIYEDKKTKKIIGYKFSPTPVKDRGNHLTHLIDALAISYTDPFLLKKITEQYKKNKGDYFVSVNNLLPNIREVKKWIKEETLVYHSNRPKKFFVKKKEGDKANYALHKDTGYRLEEIEGKKIFSDSKLLSKQKTQKELIANTIQRIEERRQRIPNKYPELVIKKLNGAFYIEQPRKAEDSYYIPIKKVRKNKSNSGNSDNMILIDRNTKRYMASGSNAYLDIFENEEGKIAFSIPTIHQTTLNYKEGIDIIPKNHKMRLYKKELYLINLPQDIFDDICKGLFPEKKLVSKYLYKLASFHLTQGCVFYPHNSALSFKANKMDSRKLSLKNLLKVNLVKVELDFFGNIIWEKAKPLI